jgi:hypothetical protein
MSGHDETRARKPNTLDDMLRSMSTDRIVRMANRARRNAELMNAKADRLFDLAHDLAEERGEHMGG